MEVGKPKRIYRVEPVRDPIPAAPKPNAPEGQPSPQQPAPTPAP